MLQLIGQVICLTFAAGLALLLAALANAAFLARRWNPLLRPSIRVIDVFHLQLKMFYSAVFGSASRFDRMMVTARNVVNEKRFAATKRRVFLAPHCLRDTECPAVSTQYGIQCIACGKCKLGEIKRACDAAGVRIFILAGSSFVKKLIGETKPEGIFLLGCPYEINKVMRHLSAYPCRGLVLSRDGCIGTDVDTTGVLLAIREEGERQASGETREVKP